jgi:hypothetical protein
VGLYLGKRAAHLFWLSMWAEILYSLCIQHPTRGYNYLKGGFNIMISKMNIYFMSKKQAIKG